MAASSWVKVGSGWHQVAKIYTKISGTWTFVKQMWAKSGGVWELVYAAIEPYTDDYTTPGSYSVPIPFGAAQVAIGVTGGGAGAVSFNSGSSIGNDGGSPAGGTAQSVIPIVSDDWGKTITIFVGSRGSPTSYFDAAPTSGTDSTCSGTVIAGAFSLTGGGATADASGGTHPGGSASGGNVANTIGGSGTSSGTRGGDSVWANGAPSTNTAPNGDGTLGSGGGNFYGNYTPGERAGYGGNGRVKLDWS